MFNILGKFTGSSALMVLKPALSLMRKNLETQFKKQIEVYNILYKNDTGQLFIIVGGLNYLYDNKMIVETIKGTAAKQLKNGETLDMLIATVQKDNSLEVRMAYTANGEKKFITHKL